MKLLRRVRSTIQGALREYTATGPSSRSGSRSRARHSPNNEGGSAEFTELFKSLLHIGDRQVRVTPQTVSGGLATNQIFVNYINLPQGIGGAGGGAEAENNRMMFVVDGFSKNDAHAPPPSGKIRVETRISAHFYDDKGQWQRTTLRAKTAAPHVIAKYLADFLSKVSREVAPMFTHTKQSSPRYQARAKSSEELAQETEFYRRRNFPGCEPRYMHGSGYNTTALHCLGFDLGSRAESLSRGKVTSVTYVLPSLDRYNEYMRLPVARHSPRKHRSAYARDSKRCSPDTRHEPYDAAPPTQRDPHAGHRMASERQRAHTGECIAMGKLLSKAGVPEPIRVAQRLQDRGIGLDELAYRLSVGEIRGERGLRARGQHSPKTSSSRSKAALQRIAKALLAEARVHKDELHTVKKLATHLRSQEHVHRRQAKALLQTAAKSPRTSSSPHYWYKGNVVAYGPFEPRTGGTAWGDSDLYHAVMAAGLTREATSAKAVLAKLESVASRIPVGTRFTVDKIYHATRGYEPNAPARSGESVQTDTYELIAQPTWYDPKIGKARTAKWKKVETWKSA